MLQNSFHRVSEDFFALTLVLLVIFYCVYILFGKMVDLQLLNRHTDTHTHTTANNNKNTRKCKVNESKCPSEPTPKEIFIVYTLKKVEHAK